MKYLNLASRLFNQPLLMEETYLATFVAAFAGQDPQADLQTITLSGGVSISAEQALAGGPVRTQSEGYQILGNGVAVIPISGTLVNKGSQLSTQSGMQGYNGILSMFSAALNDPNVNSVLLDIDSGGGEVAGCFDLCRLVAAFRDEKPIAAFVGEQACSAAYALASAAETIYIPQTGIAGSIGVLVAHQDLSKKLNKDGIKVTLIHSGKHKVDGNPFEALSAPVKEKIQGRIDSTRQMFAELVAENRSMSVEAVLATEAQTYEGAGAVEAGLADQIMSFNEVIETMSKDTELGVTAVSTTTLAAEEPVITTEVIGSKETIEVAEPEVVATIVEEVFEFASVFDPVATAELCEAAKAGSLVSNFLKNKATVESVTASLASLQELRGKLIAAEMNSEQVARVEANFDSPAELAAAVIAEMTAEDAMIRNVITTDSSDQKSQLDEETTLLYSYQTNSLNGEK